MPDLRTLERESIRAFVESCSEYFTGRVLDFGCGRQPYRDIVEAAGGTYVGFDRAAWPANVGGVDVHPAYFDLDVEAETGTIIALHSWVRKHGHFDTVLCTQVLQYVPGSDLFNTDEFFLDLRILMKEDVETLVLTYPTNWPEVEEADLHRFTKAGMTRLLVDAGFEIERHERRAEIVWNGETFALGYGVVART